MKRVVSISLGSSKRDHQVETEFLGEKFRIERIGTDGDMERMITMIRELDGRVDAFGLGGWTSTSGWVPGATSCAMPPG